jgi:hypothetical protein
MVGITSQIEAITLMIVRLRGVRMTKLLSENGVVRTRAWPEGETTYLFMDADELNELDGWD